MFVCGPPLQSSAPLTSPGADQTVIPTVSTRCQLQVLLRLEVCRLLSSGKEESLDTDQIVGEVGGCCCCTHSVLLFVLLMLLVLFPDSSCVSLFLFVCFLYSHTSMSSCSPSSCRYFSFCGRLLRRMMVFFNVPVPQVADLLRIISLTKDPVSLTRFLQDDVLPG